MVRPVRSIPSPEISRGIVQRGFMMKKEEEVVVGLLHDPRWHVVLFHSTVLPTKYCVARSQHVMYLKTSSPVGPTN